jgi:hypothetical protein
MINILIKSFTKIKIKKEFIIVFKRNLQRQTFITKEKIRESKDFIIQEPNIFSLPLEIFENTFNKDTLQEILENFRLSAHINASINNIYLPLNNYINDNIKEKNDLFKASKYSPIFILNYLKKYKDEKDFIKLKKENLEIFEIVFKYNINCFLNIQKIDLMYIYMSIDGAYAVDLHINHITTAKENILYKPISFDNTFYKNQLEKIFARIKNKKLELEHLKNSPYKYITKIVYDLLYRLDKNYLNAFVRSIITEVVKINKNLPMDTIEKFIYDKKDYIKLDASYGNLIVNLGKLFITTHTKVIVGKKIKLISLIKSIFEHIPKNIQILKNDDFEIYKEEIMQSLSSNTIKKIKLSINGSKIDTEKINKIDKLIKEKICKVNFPLEEELIQEIINFEYQQKTKSSEKSNILKMIKLLTNKQIVKIHSIIGEELIQILGDFFHLRKEEPNHLYINGEYFWTTNQSGKYPFFGVKQITSESLDIVLKGKNIKNKFIFNSTSHTQQNPMINFSSKYELHDIKQGFIDQIQNSTNTYVCKLQYEPFIHFAKAIKYFSNKDSNVDYEYLKYLIPKETQLESLKTYLSSEDFNKVINFITDLDKLSYTEFTKENNIYYLKPLITTCISNKFEVIQFLNICALLPMFLCWYPRVWSDARGRQYPYEMPLNITKSPKWRSLFSYVTYLNNVKKTETLLEETLKNLEHYTLLLEEDIIFLQRHLKNKYSS